MAVKDEYLCTENYKEIPNFPRYFLIYAQGSHSDFVVHGDDLPLMLKYLIDSGRLTKGNNKVMIVDNELGTTQDIVVDGTKGE